MGLTVVNNINTNYVLYYNILNYWKTIMNNHPSIQRVTYGDDFMIDTDEYPQYPIGNVLITNARFAGNIIKYDIQITIADKVKLKNNESIGSSNSEDVPFFGNDDTVDIHSNTLSILNDLLTFTSRANYAFTVVTEPVATPFKNEFPNGLAGWVCTMQLEAFNQQDACLIPNLLEGGVNGVQTDC